MSRVHQHPDLIYSAGTQVVLAVAVRGSQGEVLHPAGAVGVIVHAPFTQASPYRVRLGDGIEQWLTHAAITPLALFQEAAALPAPAVDYHARVILRWVIGSQAYGLAHPGSDVDRRGVYLPTAAQHWSLAGVPEQFESDATQEAFWELQKFLTLALKANPNVLECLYSPLVEFATPLGRELLQLRSAFLSRLIYQTYHGYVLSQFKKMQADLRQHGAVKWKHAMHLIRLLLSGIHALQSGELLLDVGGHRPQLMAVREGRMPWAELDAWRARLHDAFHEAYRQTALPERPDHARVNAFLIDARRRAVREELP